MPDGIQTDLNQSKTRVQERPGERHPQNRGCGRDETYLFLLQSFQPNDLPVDVIEFARIPGFCRLGIYNGPVRTTAYELAGPSSEFPDSSGAVFQVIPCSL